MESNKLYILLISVHGLIRGHDLELGRDADTGGQTLYVVELARALAALPEVARVDLMTRRVVDPQVSQDYAEPIESLCDKARIVRINAEPDEYIRKEELWDYLDSFADNALDFLRAEGLSPSLVHSHYADAGYVGRRVGNDRLQPLPMGLELPQSRRADRDDRHHPVLGQPWRGYPALGRGRLPLEEVRTQKAHHCTQGASCLRGLR